MDVEKSVKSNIEAVVSAALANVHEIDPKASLETTIDAAVDSALDMIKVPGN